MTCNWEIVWTDDHLRSVAKFDADVKNEYVAIYDETMEVMKLYRSCELIDKIEGKLSVKEHTDILLRFQQYIEVRNSTQCREIC